MKRIICLSLVLVLCLGIFGCEEGVNNASSIPPAEDSSLPAYHTSLPADDTSLPADDTSVSDENELPPLSDDQVECVDLVDGYLYIYGEVTGKFSNALILKVITPSSKEEWGEYVYIMTDQVEEWAVGDQIRVSSGFVQYPKDPADNARVQGDVIDEFAPDNTTDIYIVYEEDNFLATEENVLKAWSGSFSEEKHKEVILDYRENYTPVTFSNIGDNKSVTFEIDFEAVSGHACSIAHVDDSDINIELTSYIDSIIVAEISGNKVTMDLGWWYDESRVQNHPVWSYLVCLKDTEGNNHYYYFRVDYSAQTFEELYPLSADDAETVTGEEYFLSGKVVGKYPGALVLELNSQRAVEQWGEKVYVITEKADEWCVRDYIDLRFTEALRPHNNTQYVRIYTDEVWSHEELVPEKPIIYLYPDAPTICSVRLTLNGAFTCTYPDYEKGWDNFTAYPDGTLVFPDGKEYYALYWEGKQNAKWDLTKGFCVRGEDTAEFLEWALREQGLTAREANEFIVYWLPVMQNNPYNVISFQTDAYTQNAVLDITPAPDSMLRIFMAFYATDTAVDIPPQTFSPFVRQGFTVVEWGGGQVKNP